MSDYNVCRARCRRAGLRWKIIRCQSAIHLYRSHVTQIAYSLSFSAILFNLILHTTVGKGVVLVVVVPVHVCVVIVQVAVVGVCTIVLGRTPKVGVVAKIVVTAVVVARGQRTTLL